MRKSPCYSCPWSKIRTRTACLEAGCKLPEEYAMTAYDPSYRTYHEYVGGDTDLYKGPEHTKAAKNYTDPILDGPILG